MIEEKNDEGFHPSWLNERFSYDSAARNKQVESSCINHFNSEKEIHICDVGSGTASNLVYFLERFPQTQHWHLVEQDPVLNQYAFDRVVAFAKSLDYTFVKCEFPTIHLQKRQQDVYISFVEGSLLQLDQLIDLRQIDLVTAGAVFDLFSVDQFEAFAKMLLDNKCSLLATLNYTSMRISPMGEAIEKYIALYEAHMQRPQAFGNGMGRECPDQMISFYESRNDNKITFGESLWILDEKAKAMHQFLLGFMEESVASMIADEEEKKLFKQWIAIKRIESQKGKLKMEVKHIDLFVAFKG